jgi:hypothetical protein
VVVRGGRVVVELSAGGEAVVVGRGAVVVGRTGGFGADVTGRPGARVVVDGRPTTAGTRVVDVVAEAGTSSRAAASAATPVVDGELTEPVDELGDWASVTASSPPPQAGTTDPATTIHNSRAVPRRAGIDGEGTTQW